MPRISLGLLWTAILTTIPANREVHPENPGLEKESECDNSHSCPKGWCDRFHHHVDHLHRLGPRAIAEFLAEVSERHLCRSWIENRLADYGMVDPATLADLRSVFTSTIQEGIFHVET